MARVHSYLNFNGNCDEAFRHYQQVFKCERMSLMRYRDLPADPKYPISKADLEKVMHTSIMISPDAMLMGSDVIKTFGHKFSSGNNFHVMLHAECANEARKLFAALSKDALEIETPLGPTFFSDLFASFRDKFGVSWMISYTNRLPIES